jgi:hypothetical protein
MYLHADIVHVRIDKIHRDTPGIGDDMMYIEEPEIGSDAHGCTKVIPGGM